MKKTLVLTTIALLVSGSAVAKTWVLTNAEEGMDKGNWQINSDQLKVKDHAFSIEQKVLHGGKQEGSKILTIHSKDGLTITLSPTRGMNLLRIEGFGSRMGWERANFFAPAGVEPQIGYTWGKPNWLPWSAAEQVAEFHAVFGNPNKQTPQKAEA